MEEENKKVLKENIKGNISNGLKTKDVLKALNEYLKTAIYGTTDPFSTSCDEGLKGVELSEGQINIVSQSALKVLQSLSLLKVENDIIEYVF